ncbi:MAG: bifunctional homocysteine S-methyltransferase/methylenetetrahydrofolate reductase [Oscillospiraceae bacterium]|nr:bifunctional homocysteine S-methyltransferase/methylenetetrahydrofolate reductase [Oscillospiraceae bacterium]
MKRQISFFDGAFGTFYFEKTKDYKPCELANIHSPWTVIDIHKAYIDAGAQAIKTNTFSVNSMIFTDLMQRKEIIKAAMNNAAEAVDGTDVQVFCDIGYINSDKEDVALEYVYIANDFIKNGGENFLFETLPEFTPIERALAHIKEKNPQSVIVVSFAVSQDGYSKKGIYYKKLLQQAVDCPHIDIVGLNCQCSPSHMRTLIKNLDKLPKPLLAMPNSSYPSAFNGHMTFDDNSEYFADKMSEIFSAGADIIGGCCGTTPRHIQLAIKNVQQLNGKKEEKTAPSQLIQPKNTQFTIPRMCNSKKMIAVEIDPPVDNDMSFSISAGFKLKEAGVDIITVTDSPLARARADSIMVAAKIKREVGIETLPHLSCRDKNRISLKGSLIGASFENINNILAVTGDPIMQDIFSGKTGVFSFNSYGLISFINQLNSEVFRSTPFAVGAALNVNVPNFDRELARAKKKLENGAAYFLTQPMYSDDAVENFRRAAAELNVPVLAGLMPPASYKNAVFLNNEVSGITIKDSFVESLKDKTREEIVEISTDFCMDIARKVNDVRGGYYLMTPMKRVDLTVRLTEKIRGYMNENH